MKLSKLLVALMLAAAMALAACGDDDDDGGDGEDDEAETPAASATLRINSTPSGALGIDGSLRAGVTRIILNNVGRRPASAQLIRVEGEHSRQEFEKAFAGAGQGKPIPDWLHAEGGPGTTEPGDSTSVTQELPAGTYYAVNDEPDEPAFSSFEVSADGEGGELPETDATITAREYSFEAEGLTAGKNTILFENAGKEPHHVIALPMQQGATVADVRRFLTTEKGRPPVDFEQGAFTSVTGGGKDMAVELELKKGRYALVCFISDRAGGPPHVAKGMVSATEVN
jgi:hypothetical protein